MKRLLYLLFLLPGLFFSRPAVSQIYSISTDMFSVQGTVNVKVLESGTEKPVAYASVYLKAKNDTLITNFTLTDTTGLAKITKVTRGTYNLTVELLGFKTYNKEHYLNFSWDSETKDLGTIHLEEDHEMLDAAHVTAIGNPIEVRQDTIIFNAASFQIGQNAMLEDLLKRMPGMEVSKDGTVKYNGETIQKITVGGKTFFFDDPKMALKNLPAQVVDKVKVIDKVSDSEQFTGVATDREKVMDLEFKKEFQQGWFGNVKAGTGTTLAGDRKDEMVDDRGFLYNTNALVSGYSDKDQLVAIASAYNAPLMDEDGVIFVVRYDDESVSTADARGIQTYRQAGLNYNTTRIKGIESTAMASYSHAFNDSRSRAVRTTWVTDGADITSDSESKNFTTSDKARVSLELKNTDRKKFLITIEPSFNFTSGKTERYSDNDSRPAEGGSLINRSSSSTYLESKQFQHNASYNFGIRNLGDKRRSLTFSGSWSIADYAADSREYSETVVRAADSPTFRDLFYITDNRNYGGSLNVTYVEPIAKDWVISINTNGYASVRDHGKDAYDRTSGNPGFDASVLDRGNYTQHNDYYSTETKNTYVYFAQSFQFQYRKNSTSIQLGGRTQETLNETYTKSLDRESITGEGEWLFDWSPYFNFRWNKNQKQFNFSYSGRSSRPSAANQLPILDISVPTRLKAGNVYLRPSYRHSLSGSIYGSNPQKQSSFNLFFSGGMNVRPTVTASWFDDNGIQFSIPVNSQKPSVTGTISSGFGIPLIPSKKLQLNVSISLSGNRSVSYQNTHKIAGVDVENFDYGQFMSWFWGDGHGNLFYSGKSGFSESLTHAFSVSPALTLRYRGEKITAWTGGGTSCNISHYSLDSSADTRTWGSRINGNIDWTMPRDWELSTDITYRFFNGYPQGFNEPYTNWHLSVTKNIKAWAISFHAYDILNSTRNARHITTANYVEDTLQNQLGRHFFISVKWNFGKLNTAKNRKATDAALQMTY